MGVGELPKGRGRAFHYAAVSSPPERSVGQGLWGHHALFKAMGLGPSPWGGLEGEPDLPRPAGA